MGACFCDFAARARHNNRAPSGGGIRGGHYHSQSPEAYYIHTAGLVVAMPSTPADAKGLLSSAIRGEDPVFFLEPKALYRTVKGEVPEGEHLVPLGVGRIVRPGADVTLIAWGAMVPVAEKAAAAAASVPAWVPVAASVDSRRGRRPGAPSWRAWHERAHGLFRAA